MRRGEGAVAVRLAPVGVSRGGASLAGRVAAEDVAPALAIALRLALAPPCLAAALLTMPRSKRQTARADLPRVLLLGAALRFNLPFFLGLSSTGAMNRTLIGAATPAITAALPAISTTSSRSRASSWDPCSSARR